MINALASKNVSKAWQGRVLAVLASSTSLGRIIGPTLGDWLVGRDAVNGFEHYGRTPFWTAAASPVPTEETTCVVTSAPSRIAPVTGDAR